MVFARSEDGGEISIALRMQVGVEEVLATDLPFPRPGSDYQVAGGWTAFVRLDNGVWIREPDGTVRQVAISGLIEALNDNGDLIFATHRMVGLFPHAIRYLAKADVSYASWVRPSARSGSSTVFLSSLPAASSW